MRKSRFARGALVAAALLFGAAGCGDNSGTPAGFGPAGVPGDAVLLLAPAADSTGAYIGLMAQVFAVPPTDGFRVYVNPNNEGYRPAHDTPATIFATLGSGWNIYTIPIQDYDPGVATEFVARGAYHGIESDVSPMTNTASTPATTPAGLLQFVPVVIDTVDRFSRTPTLRWNAVPGAATYFVQVVSPVTGQILYAALSNSNVHAWGTGLGFQATPLPNGVYLLIVQPVDGGSKVFGSSFRPFFTAVPETP